MTSFGRIKEVCYSKSLDVIPDLLCLGSEITNGLYP